MWRKQQQRPGFSLLLVLIAASVVLTGCGSHFVLLHPAGPVARREWHVIELAASAMAVVIAFVFVLFAIALVRFRDVPNNRAAYAPEWSGSRKLELAWFAIPVVIVAIIAVPTVRTTYALDRIPPSSSPLIINVTSLDWKWLFEYPSQHIATVNYVTIPAGRPVLFELTADSPMNTFWVPQLGGMEYTMPGRVLPLWLQASKPGVYPGRSGNFSGSGFVHMVFVVRAVPSTTFARWQRHVRHTAQPMSLHQYHLLLVPDISKPQTYYRYPASTFPSTAHGFTLKGGMYMEMSLPHQKSHAVQGKVASQ